jgi:hypothetical protein
MEKWVARLAQDGRARAMTMERLIHYQTTRSQLLTESVSYAKNFGVVSNAAWASSRKRFFDFHPGERLCGLADAGNRSSAIRRRASDAGIVAIIGARVVASHLVVTDTDG